MKTQNVLAGIAAVAAAVSVAGAASATTYVYVGSWELGAGAHWTTNPPVYSGQGAAALLFGGVASNYVTSTVDSNPADINFETWLDGWADPVTYATSGSPAADTYSLDTGGGGYDSNPGYQSAYSAYVQDHFNGTDPTYTNYAFQVVGVPEPAAWALMLVGFGAMGLCLRARRRTIAAAA